MKDSLNINDVKKIFTHVAQQVVDNENYLTIIDKKIGDGDHGINMALGFKQVKHELNTREFNSINDIFHCIGMTLLDTMGGASGVLFGTMFISGIVGLEPIKEIDLSVLAGIFEKSLAALKKRGKANVGDKTMVDAFEPAAAALTESANDGLSIIDGLERASEAAKIGMESTKNCIARFGRAKSYGKASLGLEDAGSVSVWIIFKSMAECASAL